MSEERRRRKQAGKERGGRIGRGEAGEGGRGGGGENGWQFRGFSHMAEMKPVSKKIAVASCPSRIQNWNLASAHQQLLHRASWHFFKVHLLESLSLTSPCWIVIFFIFVSGCTDQKYPRPNSTELKSVHWLWWHRHCNGMSTNPRFLIILIEIRACVFL